MSTVINREKYRKLLGACLPQVIENSAEHKEMLHKAETLMLKGESLTEEEKMLLKLIVSLVQQYEKSKYPIPPAAPLEVLEYLMEERQHTAKDLWKVLGDKSAVSRILSGERQISKEQCKRLVEFYRVSPAVFI